MADPRALVRVTSEFLWSLRREGFEVAPSQAVDVARAFVLLGFEDRVRLRDAVGAVVDVRRDRREAFEHAFERFFDAGSRLPLRERLAQAGASESEIAAIEEYLAELASDDDDATLTALLEGRGELTRLLGARGTADLLATADSPLKAGFLVHKVVERLGAGRARTDLDGLSSYLVDAFGEARSNELVGLLRAELSRTLAEIRDHVKKRATPAERARDGSAIDTPFDELSSAEVAEVRRAVRVFVEKLRGREAVRRRRASRGKIASGPTVRRAFRTFGVPLFPVLRAKTPRKPRLVVLCDISESMRQVARFLLELVYLAQSLVDDTRTFVFVSELGETTQLFASRPVSSALAEAYGGRVVSIASNSNYGRVFRSFAERHLASVDRRTTVVVLGDGRTNYLDDGAEALDAIGKRARALVWMCPESRGAWGQGDSAMARYAPKCTSVLEVRSARELEDAVRRVLR
jgi:hypothetical protein